MFNSEFVRLEIEERIAKIVISREESLNALNTQVLLDLEQALLFLEQCSFEECRVAVISGAGNKAFVAGADIKLMLQAGPTELANFAELGQRVMRRIEGLRLPVIAVVGGFAIGGGLELALACDLIIASKKAKFGQAEVNLGLIPGFGGTQRLTWRVGTGAARKIVYTGDTVDAEEAYRIGLVDWLESRDELNQRVTEIAQQLITKGPLALAAAKRSVQKATETQLLAGLRSEVEEFLALFQYEDTREGLQAFVEKRKANFQGK